jgi:selenocysteine lyase/cysteine desulfurase
MPYLNQAGTSWPKPEPVRAAVAEALAVDPSTWDTAHDRAWRAVAAHLGSADHERLLLTPGCTSALAVAVADHAWQAGDRVLCSGYEHHALHRPLLALAGRDVELVVIPPAGDGPLDLEALRHELRRGRVRMVALSAASNVTGEILPCREVIRLAHEHDALCLLDAAQVTGWLPIDVAELDVDLLAFAGHKALHGPWGIGGLYVAPRVTMTTPAATCSIGAGKACAPMPGPCDVGSVDRAALAGLEAALAWLAAPERAERLAVARDLTEHVEGALSMLPGVTLLARTPASERLPTVAFTSRIAPAAIARSLFARGVVVAHGLQCAPLAHETLGSAARGAVRISFGPQNTEEDAARVVEELQAVLE